MPGKGKGKVKNITKSSTVDSNIDLESSFSGTSERKRPAYLTYGCDICNVHPITKIRYLFTLRRYFLDGSVIYATISTFATNVTHPKYLKARLIILKTIHFRNTLLNFEKKLKMVTTFL